MTMTMTMLSLRPSANSPACRPPPPTSSAETSLLARQALHRGLLCHSAGGEGPRVPRGRRGGPRRCRVPVRRRRTVPDGGGAVPLAVGKVAETGKGAAIPLDEVMKFLGIKTREDE